MTQLYTSLVRLKQELNSGVLPPMMLLPEAVREKIDPALTIGGDGWGGLVEDYDKGLLCCVRGCGEYHRNLTAHLQKSHQEIGGALGFKNLMGIPRTAPLVSQHTQSAYAPTVARKGIAGAGVRRKGRTRRSPSINSLNLRDSCAAQLQTKIIALSHRIGRAPNLREFNIEYGRDFERAIVSVFGTWPSALAQCGIERVPCRSGWRTEWNSQHSGAVLQAWYDIHGELPDQAEVERRDKLPLLPPMKLIMKSFHTASWWMTMQRAAAYMGIQGGKYGLPVRHVG